MGTVFKCHPLNRTVISSGRIILRQLQVKYNDLIGNL